VLYHLIFADPHGPFFCHENVVAEPGVSPRTPAIVNGPASNSKTGAVNSLPRNVVERRAESRQGS